MLNSEAPPFPYPPPPPPYYYPLSPNPPPFFHRSIPSCYHPSPYSHPTHYFFYRLLPPPPPPPLFSYDLAAQLSHLTFSEAEQEEEAEHLTATTTTNPVSRIPFTALDHHDPPPPPPLLPPVGQSSSSGRGKERVPFCRSADKAPTSSTGGMGSYASGSSSSTMSLEFDRNSLHPDGANRTTVMIKNIPNQFRRDMLIQMLDNHCRKENETANLLGGFPPSEYDFVYLPMDFSFGCNLGYAFVNFTSAAAAGRLYRAIHLRKWAVFDSKKIVHVCYARIQGKEALVANFKHSLFCCNTDEFLPAVLSPPRNGCTALTPPAAVGRRTKRATLSSRG